MAKEQHIIYVPGLFDQKPLTKTLVKALPHLYKHYRFHLHVFYPYWEEGKSFEPKLKRLLKEIDDLFKKGHIISLIGQSAGGSFVLNAFCKRKNIVSKVINVTGRLRKGENVNPTLEVASKYSPAFKESVFVFEKKNEPTLSKTDRKRIMTIRPFWDEVVPAPCVPLEGSLNIIAPFPEHTLGGILIMTLLSKKIFEFLNC